MKKLAYIIIAVLGLAVVVSCEKENDNPVLNTDQTVAPVLSTNFESLVLSEDNADDSITFQWTEAKYSIDNIKQITYTLEMRHADSTEYTELINTAETSYSTKVGAFNVKLLGMGYAPETPMDFAFRVMAYLNTDSEATTAYSELFTANVTAYEEMVEVAPIYLLGSATTVGWDNGTDLALEHVEKGKFEIVAYLESGSDAYIKFIANPGNWAPQWGTDDNGTWESGNLIYRPTEDVEDPAAIPAPPDAGEYIIQADTANLTYSVSAVSKKYLINE